MKNFISAGETLTFTNAGQDAIASGAGVLLGAVFGVAASTIPAGDEGVINLSGEYELPKAAGEAWAVGDRISWDGDACTTGDGELIGFATQPALAAATVGTVRLNGTINPAP